MFRPSHVLSLAALVLAAPLGLSGLGSEARRGLTPEQLEILGFLHLVELDDGQGNVLKTIEIRGVNVRIVNGLGATNGAPHAPFDPAQAVTNGLGNLILGYAEGDGQRLRTGSHNLVLGQLNQWSSWGGMVGGSNNRLQGPLAGVVGGADGFASGLGCAVVGGWMNQAAGQYSGVVGGARGSALGDFATITGGFRAQALGVGSSVAGGSINRASGDFATVAGGLGNQAEGANSTVGGGFQRHATGSFDWVAGGLLEEQ
jgi:hypothetical protein